MKIKIRAVPERKEFVDYMISKIPEATPIFDYEHFGRKHGNQLFADTLGGLDDDTILIEDDQLICDNFTEKAKEVINKFPDRVIAFSWLKRYGDDGKQFVSEKKINMVNSNAFHYGLDICCLFRIYIPKKVGNDFNHWFYNKKIETVRENFCFNSKGQWYDQLFALYLKESTLSVYIHAFPSLTGHYTEFRSAMHHKQSELCKSMNFDYEKYEKEYLLWKNSNHSING